MSATALDTPAYSKILQEAGIFQAHAEVCAKAQKLALDEMLAVKEIARLIFSGLKTRLGATSTKY